MSYKLPSNKEFNKRLKQMDKKKFAAIYAEFVKNVKEDEKRKKEYGPQI